MKNKAQYGCHKFVNIPMKQYADVTKKIIGKYDNFFFFTIKTREDDVGIKINNG